MGKFKRAVAICAVAGVAALGTSAAKSAAFADPPGPGDKQCVPGQNSQPQPGKKGGSC